MLHDFLITAGLGAPAQEGALHARASNRPGCPAGSGMNGSWSGRALEARDEVIGGVGGVSPRVVSLGVLEVGLPVEALCKGPAASMHG